MNPQRVLRWMFSVTLIAVMLSGYSRVHAQPRSGDWKVSTGFGELGFAVNTDGSKITKIIFDCRSWSCGPVSGSWKTTVSWTDPTAGWPISNNQFAIIHSGTLGSFQTVWTINGTFNQTGDEASGTWGFGISGTTCSGNWSPARVVTVEKLAGDIPERYLLAQNYPNPFNPSTTIEFALPRTSHVSIRVYDVLGLEVATLVDDQLPPGEYKTTWNAADIASGVYLCRIQAGDFVQTRKLILLR
jgi:hypothetical protein